MSKRHLAFMVGTFLVASVVAGCGDDGTTEPTRPDVEPGVRLLELDANPISGFAPMEVSYKLRFETADPRADVTVFIDFGDGEDDSEFTQTSLPEELQDDETETSLEERTVTFTHTYVDPGIYTVSIYARDTTNSVSDGDELIEIISDPLTVDIEAKELPDLIGVDIRIDKNEIDIDEPFMATYTVLNDGSDVARPFDMHIYLVRYPNMTVEEMADPQVWIQLTVVRSPESQLLSGATISGSFEARLCDPRVAPGSCDIMRSKIGDDTWYPAIFVDAPDALRPEINVLERDEENNFKVGTPGLSVRPVADLADLTPENVVANPATTNVLREITVSFEMHNIGEAAAQTSTYDVFLSVGDDQLDPLDQRLGSGLVNAVAPGGKQTVANLSFQVAEEIRNPGEYWVLVKVDSQGVIPEISEYNNTIAAPRSIKVLGVDPRVVDLTTTDLTVEPMTTYVGGQLAVAFNANNVGTDDSGSYQCSIFLSDDDALDGQNDVLLMMVGADNLAGGTSEPYYRVLFVPDYVSAGSYYIFAECDSMGVVLETDEDNNIAGPSGMVTVNTEPQVDFFTQSVAMTPTTLSERDNLEITVEICNIGTDYAQPIGAKAYLSADATVDTTDFELANSVITTLLAPSQCETVVMTGKVTCLPFIDSYTIGVIVDPNDVVIELDEANNTALSPDTLTVAGAVNSLCGCTEDSAEGTGNNDQANASLVTLTGTDPKVATLLDLALCDSTDVYQVDLDRGDTLTATLTFDSTLGDLDLSLTDPNSTEGPWLSAGTGGTEVLTRKVVSTNANVVYLEVFPKAGGRNYYTLDIEVIPSPTEPELSVSAVTLTGGLTPLVFNPYDFEVEVANTGLGDSTPFDLTVYFSTNTVLDASDIAVGTATIAALPAYSNHVEPFTYTFDPATPTGGYYFIAVADSGDAIVEVDEANNATASNRFNLDAHCIPDAFEGPTNNDTSATAWGIRPTSTLQTWSGLSVCNLGRGDFYRICVPSGEPLSHVAVVQESFASSADAFELAIYNMDNVRIDIDYAYLEAIVGLPVPSYACTADTDCASTETCQAGFCADSAGDYCIYADVHFRSTASALVESYTLVVDATAVSNQNNEPENDASATPTSYSVSTEFLAAGNGKVGAKNDIDWFYLDLKAGTTFQAGLNTADEDMRMMVHTTSMTTGTLVEPWEPKSVTVATDMRIHFRVYKVAVSSADPDNDSAYTIDLGGIAGIDLVPLNMSTNSNIAWVNDAVLVNWDLSNLRMDSPAGGVEYQYVLSADGVVDGSDWVLGTMTTAAPAPFTTVNQQDKIYLTVPDTVFGDYNILVDVDPSNLIVEENETNNVIGQPISIAQVCNPDAQEPNNSTGAATPLTLAAPGTVSVTGASICVADVDYYSVTVPNGVTFEFAATNMVIFERGDLDMFLYDSTGTLLDLSNGVNTTTETITYTNNTGADLDVVLQMRPFLLTYSNVYDLDVTWQ